MKTKKKSFRVFAKRTIALTLALTMMNTSTSISGALIHSGLIEYFGSVKDNIVSYYNAHYVHASEEVTLGGDGSPSAGVVGDTTNNITNYNYDYSTHQTTNEYTVTHECDHSGVISGLGSINTILGTISGNVANVDDIWSYLTIDQRNAISDIIAKATDIQKDTVEIKADAEVIAQQLLPAIVSSLKVEGETNVVISELDRNRLVEMEGGETITNLMSIYKMMMNTWYDRETIEALADRIKHTLVPGEIDTADMINIADNISIERKTLTNSYGYTDVYGDLWNESTLADSAERYNQYMLFQTELANNPTYMIDMDRYQRNISNDLLNINDQLFSNFGYYQYDLNAMNPVIYDPDNWEPSIAKDFYMLLKMYKNYKVAHVYSLNAHLNTEWQPTSEEVSFSKDRVLTKGYANAYLGFWDVAVADYAPAITNRYFYVLGPDILIEAEGFMYEVYRDKEPEKITIPVTNVNATYDGEVKDAELPFSSFTISATRAVEYMELEESISLSNALRILYRALGQEVRSYDYISYPNHDIKAETSPVVQNLSNPNTLDGYDVYVGVNRNNVITFNPFSDNQIEKQGLDATAVGRQDVYLDKAIKDGLVSGFVSGYDSKSVDAAIEMKLTAAEFWVLASRMMQLYGEPEMNSTEILSLLQVYGSYYPIQCGRTVADAWAYLQARGVLTDNSIQATDYLSVEQVLDIAMRIADRDSRINYKELQLVITLDQAVIDSGYFPLFSDNLSVVDAYTTTRELDYTSATGFDILIEGEEFKTNSYIVKYIQGGKEITVPDDQKVSIGQHDLGLVLSYPHTLTSVSEIQLYSQTGGAETLVVTIPNSQLGTGGRMKVDDSGNFTLDTFDTCTPEENYLTFVDSTRCPVTMKFAWASSDATLAERVVFFLDYIFTPATAHAAFIPPNSEPKYALLVDGGSAYYTMSKSTSTRDLWSCVLLTYLFYSGEWGTGYDTTLNSHDPHLTPKWGKDVDSWIIKYFADIGYPSGLSIVGNELFKLGFKENNYPSRAHYASNAAKNLVLDDTWYVANSNALAKTAVRMWLLQDKALSDKVHPDGIEGYNNYIASARGFFNQLRSIIRANESLDIGWATTLRDGNSFIFRMLYSAEDTIGANAISGKFGKFLREDVADVTVAETDGLANTDSEIVGNIGGGIDPIKDIYAKSIMDNNQNLYYAYEELLKQGIVETKQVPLPDENGIIEFYIKDKGQVIIDTINKSATVNCIRINMMGDYPPVYINENTNGSQTLYVNYKVLVGALATYEVTGTTTETTSGAGSGASYEVATGLSVSEDTKVSSGITHYNVENDANSSTVKSYLLEKYDGTSVADKNLILLSTIFPTSNWAIVEENSKAYLYTFYNAHMFYKDSSALYIWNDDATASNRVSYTDNSGNNDDGLTTDGQYFYWNADRDIAKLHEDSLSLYKMVKVGDTRAYDTIMSTYGLTEDGVSSVGILNSTVIALSSLAYYTNTTILNTDYVCRVFDVQLAQALSDVTDVGKVYFLRDVGYVYNAPTTYSHVDYVEGNHWIPLVYTDNKVVEYNLNSYGDINNGDTQVDLPYGWTVRQSDSGISVEYITGDEVALVDSGDLINNDLNISNSGNKVIGAPAGIFKYIVSPYVDNVTVGTLSKFTTTACSFYLGAKRLYLVEGSGTAVDAKQFSFNKDVDTTAVRINENDSATVSTRDFKGKHHFVLSPNTKVISTVQINTVNADSYAVEYSDNPIYAGIKAWITNLDSVTSTILYILFYVVPYILLLWVLLLVMLALVPNKAVAAVGTIVGMDIVSILTLGRRSTSEWRGVKVVAPLIIAFVALGLFYGPNLLRIIEIVSDWAYSIAGL